MTEQKPRSGVLAALFDRLRETFAVRRQEQILRSYVLASREEQLARLEAVIDLSAELAKIREKNRFSTRLYGRSMIEAIIVGDWSEVRRVHDDIRFDDDIHNDPCPCGSGKKYKKCCLGKHETNAVGFCLAPMGGDQRCGKPATTALFCKLCGRQYPWCGDEQHKKDAQTMINEHVVRAHPEHVPTDVFDKWLKDPVWMAMHEEQRAKSPELWARLFEYIDERRSAAGPN